MTTEDDFHKQLDANPDDHQTRLVFADWLQERGDPRAAGYRALGVHRISPFIGRKTNVRPGSGGWTHEGNPLPEMLSHRLHNDWWALTDKGLEDNEWFVYHPNRREAEDAAALAFSKLPPERQNELLGTHEGYQPGKLSRLSARRRSVKTYKRSNCVLPRPPKENLQTRLV